MRKRLVLLLCALAVVYAAVEATVLMGFVPPWVWWRYMRGGRR